MENCLVTKLKGSVDNDILPVLNSLVIDVEPGQFGITLLLPIGATVKCNNSVDTIYLGTGGDSPITFPWVNNIDPDTTNRQYFNGTLTQKTRFIVDCKYTTRKLRLADNTIHITDDILESVKYNTNLTEIDFSSNNRDINGSINFSDIKNNDVTVISLKDEICSGNISELIRCTKLIIVYIQRNTNVTGILEGFISGVVAAGRTSGTIEADMRNTGITFHENPIASLSSGLIYINFNSTGATVENASHTLLGTYSNGTWTYA